jgi:phage terminase small subunit
MLSEICLSGNLVNKFPITLENGEITMPNDPSKEKKVRKSKHVAEVPGGPPSYLEKIALACDGY